MPHPKTSLSVSISESEAASTTKILATGPWMLLAVDLLRRPESWCTGVIVNSPFAAIWIQRILMSRRSISGFFLDAEVPLGSRLSVLSSLSSLRIRCELTFLGERTAC